MLQQLREIIIHLLQLFTSVHDSVLLLSAGRLWSQLVSMDVSGGYVRQSVSCVSMFCCFLVRRSLMAMSGS